MKKRILCMIVSAMMCVSLLPVSGFAEELPEAEVSADESISEEAFEEPALLQEEQTEEPSSEAPVPDNENDRDKVYFVTAEECTGGKIILTETEYEAGDTVEFTASPDEGFTFTGAAADPMTDITEGEDGTCSFIMPESDVRINAFFEKPVEVQSGKFVSGIAVTAGGYTSQKSPHITFAKNGFAIMDHYYADGTLDSDPKADLNEGAGGKYIFLGTKYQNDFDKNLITGLILLENSGKPSTFTFRGKDYHPLPDSNQLEDSNGDLNQGAGGYYLYLYYTTDGADKGDPVLTHLYTAKSPDTFSHSDYVWSVQEYTDEWGLHTEVTYPGDVNKEGKHLYLYPTYHTHNLLHNFDENQHWDTCTSCGYVSAREAHEYSYTFGKYSYEHEASCACGYKFMEDHVDADHDNKCDFCDAELVAEVGGLYFESFFGAWEYAVGKECDASVTLLQDDAVEDTLFWLGNGHTVTVTGAGGEKAPVLMLDNSIFSIESGTLVMDIDVECSGLKSDNLFQVSGNDAGLCIRSGNINVRDTDAFVSEAVIKAENSAEIIISGGNITGADRAITALECRNINITGGVFSGGRCALHLIRTYRTKITGGTFKAGDSGSIEVAIGSVKDIFPAGYHCYVEETGKRVAIEDGTDKISENVTVEYKPFNISTTSEGNGTVKCSAQSAAYGETIQLTVNAMPGNRFERWETSDVSVSDEHTFVMPEKEVSIKAVFAENEPVSYLDENGEEQSNADYGKLTSNMTTLPAGWYLAEGNLSFDTRIETEGDIHLILKDGSTLEAAKGIHVGAGSSLTVYAQSTGDEAGAIFASAKDNRDDAGIGGNFGESSGVVTINGGKVEAESVNGAGIGGGSGTGGLHEQSGGNGTVIINGGKVKAVSNAGAGIGGGNLYGKGEVTINGGKAEAESIFGAGIGGGNNYGKGEVTINGGEVSGTCISQGAGIGGGRYGDADITINGGTVYAKGRLSAGLGCENDEACTARITITGGKVDAVSTFTNAICSGREGSVKVVPGAGYSLEVKTENDTEITGSPFGTETDITEKLKGSKEVHIKEVQKPSYDITVTTNGHGSVKIQTNGTDVKKAYAGETVTLLASPDKGYHFGSWQSEDVTAAADGTFTMPGHAVEIRAEFEEGKLNLVGGKAATCTEDGYKSCYQCDCGKYFEDAAGSKPITDYNAWKEGEGKIPAGHTYGTPEYTWNADKCTAVRVCSACTEGTKGHLETETKDGIYIKDTEVNCAKAETGHYAVEKFDNPAFSAQQTQKGSVVKGEPLGHAYGTPEYTWDKDRCTAVRVCSVCEEGCEGHFETETKAGAYVKDAEATCIRAERGHYTVEKFDNPAFSAQQTKKYSAIKGEPLGHRYGIVYWWSGDMCTANGVCSVCKEGSEGHIATETKVGVYVKDTDATCTTPETGHYVVEKFDNPVFSPQQTEKGSVVKGEPLGHKYGEPTYTWDEYRCTAERVCRVCKEDEEGHRETETQIGIFIKETEATCTKAETGHYETGKFANPAFTQQHTDKCTATRGKPLGHKYGEPMYTIVKDEVTASRVCSVCPEGTEGRCETEVKKALYIKDTDATCTTPEMGHYVVEGFKNPAFPWFETEKNSEVNGYPLGHDYVIEQYSAAGHRYVCQNDKNHSYTEEHTFEGDVCTACGYTRGNVFLIIYGVGSEWTKGSREGCIITSNAPYAKFVSVKVDGSLLSETNYTVKEGSTKITLKAEYLETLDLGEHAIEIISSDGSASTFFTVNPWEAPFVPASFTVTFNMNGHGEKIPDRTVSEGSSVSRPEDPKAAGCTFKGWYADSALTVPFDFDAAVTADTVIYAKWEMNGSGSKDPAKPAGPGTGDENSTVFWMGLMVLMTGIAGYSVVRLRRKMK